MKRDEVLRILAERREELAELGVRSLSLFGSVARNEARPDSDIDLLVEFDRPIGLFGFVKLKMRLEGMLGRRVDLVVVEGLKRRLRDRVLSEAIRAA